MITGLLKKSTFINNSKHKKLSNNLILEKSFTPVKIISKDQTKISNFKEKKTNLLYSKKIRNNIKLKLLIPTKKNSRNYSSLNGFTPKGILTQSNCMALNTNNSLSRTTNLKTTIDTNITKTQNIKDKINNKENSILLDSKLLNFFSSSSKEGKKSEQAPINNISQNKKRPKIKINKSNSNTINQNYKKNKKNIISKHSPFKKSSKENNNITNINHNNNSFIIPNRIILLKNIYNNFLTPIRNNTKLKCQNSLSLKKKINRLENNLNIINIKKKTIDQNEIMIKKSKLKNIYMLLEKQKESIYNRDIIKKEKEDIEKIKDKLKKVREKNIIINNEAKILNEKLINNKRELIVIQTNIDNILNDKKNVNTMIILLHRRIIDIKKRIKEHEEKKYYLDKSLYELSLKFQGINIINK